MNHIAAGHIVDISTAQFLHLSPPICRSSLLLRPATICPTPWLTRFSRGPQVSRQVWTGTGNLAESNMWSYMSCSVKAWKALVHCMAFILLLSPYLPEEKAQQAPSLQIARRRLRLSYVCFALMCYTIVQRVYLLALGTFLPVVATVGGGLWACLVCFASHLSSKRHCLGAENKLAKAKQRLCPKVEMSKAQRWWWQ